jgi:hypothetical protein
MIARGTSHRGHRRQRQLRPSSLRARSEHRARLPPRSHVRGAFGSPTEPRSWEPSRNDHRLEFPRRPDPRHRIRASFEATASANAIYVRGNRACRHLVPCRACGDRNQHGGAQTHRNTAAESGHLLLLVIPAPPAVPATSVPWRKLSIGFEPRARAVVEFSTVRWNLHARIGCYRALDIEAGLQG